jgi:hypothetical protein
MVACLPLVTALSCVCSLIRTCCSTTRCGLRRNVERQLRCGTSRYRAGCWWSGGRDLSGAKAEVIQNEDLATNWRDFAENNCKGYSPLYESFTRACADSAEVMDFVRSLPAHAHQPNLLLAAIHERVLLGLEPDLSLFYSGEKTGDAGHFIRESGSRIA